MDDDKKSMTVLLCLWSCTLLALLVPIFGQDPEASASTVPLFGLPIGLHIFLVLFLLPTVLSILFAIFFPMIFTPLFIKIKRAIWRDFKNAYIELETPPFNFKKFFSRGIFISLLAVGLTGAILSFDILNLRLFISEFDWKNMAEENYALEYQPNVYFGLLLLTLPLVIGIWSVGWMMDDAGLIHYNLPKADSNKHFEIEPMHSRYNSLIKGYAGISAIVFYISVISYYVTYHPSDIGSLFFVITIGFLLILSSIPAYLAYWKISRPIMRKILTKTMKEVERITELQFK